MDRWSRASINGGLNSRRIIRLCLSTPYKLKMTEAIDRTYVVEVMTNSVMLAEVRSQVLHEQLYDLSVHFIHAPKL